MKIVMEVIGYLLIAFFMGLISYSIGKRVKMKLIVYKIISALFSASIPLSRLITVRPLFILCATIALGLSLGWINVRDKNKYLVEERALINAKQKEKELKNEGNVE